MAYDFEGYATKNDLRCSDGLTIRKGAFSENNGKRVPLVWNHQHNSVDDVLGHADLESRDDGVYARCSFNKTAKGQNAKEAVQHGDVVALSIWANNLQKVGSDIFHGVIREVSLVLAGANPGAFIESVLSHGDPIDVEEDEGIFYTSEGIHLCHSDDGANKEDQNMGKENRTVRQVLDELTDEQKAAVGLLIEQAVEDSEEEDNYDEYDEYDDEEDDEDMKHNVFEDDMGYGRDYISHDDMTQIVSDAKRIGSLREAINEHIEHGVLSHAIDTTGMDVATGNQRYGFNDPSMLFPDYKSLNNPPEWISRNMDWVSKVMAKVHHIPFTRIKSLYANITEDEARARGYIKGKQKKEEVFTTLKRTTTPQTIYKKQKLDRDDILDITDFDVVAWIRAEMRVMLNEEIARAILIGDGRMADSEDKIQEEHVRPVVGDVPLFNTVIKVSVPANATTSDIAKETIKAIIRGRKNYKGSGRPDFFTTEDSVTEMLLLEDGIGHSLYKTEGELATKLRVNETVTVEPMEGHKVKITEGSQTKEYPLIGVIVNLADYNVGADKGGDVNMFDDFDIDFNQYKYLIETRISGALVKPFSALTVVLDRAAQAAG